MNCRHRTRCSPTESKTKQLILVSFGAVSFIQACKVSGCGRQGQEFDPAYHTQYPTIGAPDRRCERRPKKLPASNTTTNVVQRTFHRQRCKKSPHLVAFGILRDRFFAGSTKPGVGQTFRFNQVRSFRMNRYSSGSLASDLLLMSSMVGTF